MKSLLLRRPNPIPRRPRQWDAKHRDTTLRDDERGVTMILVAICMIAIIAMAALSIDVVTLYLNREEAQRSADTAALAAARVISISGITGTASTGTDTTSWQAVCGTSGTATQVAQQVGAINAVSGTSGTVNVTYSAQGATGGASDCSTLGPSFAINPSVTVVVKRTGLPTMFSRIWSRNTNTVSATGIAEVFNPSDSGSIAPGGQEIPVVPRCVKPLILPDEDPGHVGKRFTARANGKIDSPGIQQVDGNGVIGENITLASDCGTGGNCGLTPQNPPTATATATYYIPALINTATATAAVPSCATNDFQKAFAGCDSTQYQCGTVNGANADLTINPASDAATAAQCLVGGAPPNNDTLNTSAYPFQIVAGAANPIASTNQVITSSNSIMTFPLYSNTATLTPGQQPQVTIVGYLQVFVTGVITSGPNNGNITGTVLNVSGCGDNASTTLSAPGSSPVPIRLITPQ